MAKVHPELVMSVVIPLDLQRRCEQRWAARFVQPMPTATRSQSDRKDKELPSPGLASDLRRGNRSPVEPEASKRKRPRRSSRPGPLPANILGAA
jgi:hypothetical protein